MSIDAPPPQLPPQMSPDGKWIWDGAEWRPIPVHEAAFPNWKGVGAGFAPDADTRAPVVTAPPAKRQAAPPASYRLAGPAPGVVAPNWGRGSRGAGIRRYAQMAAMAAGVLVLIVMVSVVGTLILSNRPSQGPSGSVTAPNSVGPVTRSESAEADYLVKGLTGPLSDQRDTIAVLRETCAAMTSSCEEYYITMGDNLAPILPIFDRARIPTCIAIPANALRADIAKALDGQQLALKGFHDNKKSEWAAAYTVTSGALAQAGLAFAAVKNAVPSCDTAVIGP